MQVVRMVLIDGLIDPALIFEHSRGSKVLLNHRVGAASF